jgi:ribosomal protein S18 acetylase RimI-like enzyme
VSLHIECVAPGTQNGSSAANRMRIQVMRLLTKDFSRKYIGGPVLARWNLREDTDAAMLLNLDNRVALQIALLNDAGSQMAGAAILHMHGPAFGYLQFFAVSQAQRGNGLGSRFVQALCSVLRWMGGRYADRGGLRRPRDAGRQGRSLLAQGWLETLH